MSTSSPGAPVIGDDAARLRSSRWSAMLDLLARSGRLGVAEAADQLGVSEATIRRDFAELARRQLVTRQHGGVVAASVAYELPYRYRESQNDGGLARIAEVAAALVVPGTVVAMNGGTTTTATARALMARDDLVPTGGAPGLTLVTSALNIAAEAVLRPHVRCVSLGGIPRPESYEVTGPMATAGLAQLWIDVAVLGVNGLTAIEGATCRFEDEAEVTRTMVARARSVVVVTMPAKIGERAFASICPPGGIDHVVTTAPVDGEGRGAEAVTAELDRLRDEGVTVHLA